MSGACLRIEEKEKELEGLTFSIVLGPHCPFNGCADSQVGVEWNDRSACCLRSLIGKGGGGLRINHSWWSWKLMFGACLRFEEKEEE